MLKQLFLILLLLISRPLLAQEVLDLEKNRDCELFPEKGKFDAGKRLREIKEIGGREVTVFIVKGKDNKIKSSYTGKVDLKSIDDDQLSLQSRTAVLVVAIDLENGNTFWHLPLTNDKSYRIYLTDCISK